jgi:hypothetical protein
VKVPESKALLDVAESKLDEAREKIDQLTTKVADQTDLSKKLFSQNSKCSTKLVQVSKKLDKSLAQYTTKSK